MIVNAKSIAQFLKFNPGLGKTQIGYYYEYLCVLIFLLKCVIIAEITFNDYYCYCCCIGEYISKGPADLFPFHAHVLREYVNTFDFSGF
jgi:hypothetical protein